MAHVQHNLFSPHGQLHARQLDLYAELPTLNGLVCSACGSALVTTSELYAACPNCTAPLRPEQHDNDQSGSWFD